MLLGLPLGQEVDATQPIGFGEDRPDVVDAMLHSLQRHAAAVAAHLDLFAR